MPIITPTIFPALQKKAIWRGCVSCASANTPRLERSRAVWHKQKNAREQPSPRASFDMRLASVLGFVAVALACAVLPHRLVSLRPTRVEHRLRRRRDARAHDPQISQRVERGLVDPASILVVTLSSLGKLLGRGPFAQRGRERVDRVARWPTDRRRSRTPRPAVVGLEEIGNVRGALVSVVVLHGRFLLGLLATRRRPRELSRTRASLRAARALRAECDDVGRGREPARLELARELRDDVEATRGGRLAERVDERRFDVDRRGGDGAGGRVGGGPASIGPHSVASPRVA